MELQKTIRRQIGKQLAQIRQERRILQEEVAKKCYLKLRTLDNIELGSGKNWRACNDLLKFYKKKIKIELVDDDAPFRERALR